jgi:hypothetical protein
MQAPDLKTQPTLPARITAGDFCPCPICDGKGTYSEPSATTPGAVLTSPCWSCLGTGMGK